MKPPNPMLVLAALNLWLGASSAGAQSDVARLRSIQPTLAAVIGQANERSMTFHHLISRLSTTDGLIYVGVGHCGHGVRACVPHSIIRAGQFRLMWILIDPHDAEFARTEQLAATIGHELHHALALLSNPSVTNAASMFMFYAREPPRDGVFETEEATSVGNRVHREMLVSLAGSHLAMRP